MHNSVRSSKALKTPSIHARFFGILALLAANKAAAHGEIPVPAPVFVHPNPQTGQPMGSATWQVSGDGNHLTVHQTSDTVALDWQKFNIGAHSSVRFDQPAAASVALNYIHQADPSKILGVLSANGQVYLLNQNGFEFGRGAQVNLNSLVATTLNITEASFQKGITQLVDPNNGGTPAPALVGNGQVYRRDGNGNLIPDSQGQSEKIQVRIDAGAKIATNAPGGRILIVAPSIVNAGEIDSPDGQTILAAATDKVYLEAADAASGVRGLLVEVQTGGDVTNLGRILTARGNATLEGFAVNQDGLVSATTTVSLNGSVRLLAREGASSQLQTDASGNSVLAPGGITQRASDEGDMLGRDAGVTLGPNSVTRVGLDRSGGTAVDAQQQPHSKVEIMGSRISMQGGSHIVAPSGTVSMTATANPQDPSAPQTTPDNRSRLELDAGSSIDVSGTRNVVLPMSRNIVSVQLLSYELRDAPLQKKDALYGKTVNVDIRKGTQIADISGALARIQRSVAERNSAGGTINLTSDGDTLVDAGAAINVSGGAVHYQAGYVNTTKLISDGQVYDISSADPNRSYQTVFGVFSKAYPRWNRTDTWAMPGPLSQGILEPAYVQGMNAGALNITSRALSFLGKLVAGTVDGWYQRLTADRASGGSFSIDTAWSGLAQPSVVFQQGPPSAAAGASPGQAAAGGLPSPILFADDWFRNSGIQHLNIDTAGSIRIDRNAVLALSPGGSLQLTGSDIAVQGAISAPSGSVALDAQGSGGTGAALGSLSVGDGASIDVAGGWVNDHPGGLTPEHSPVAVDGGSVSLGASNKLSLAGGSRIDVSGGAWLQSNATVTAGKAGSIALAVSTNPKATMALNGALLGYGLGQGGSLDLTADSMIVSSLGNAAANAAALTNPLVIAPSLFAQDGFSRFSLTSIVDGISVNAGETIRLQTLNRVLNPGYSQQPTGTPLSRLGQIELLPDYQRKAADLSLTLKQSDDNNYSYVPDAAITIGRGARILADPGANIQLSSDANLRVDGVISASAGNIGLTVASPSNLNKNTNGYLPNQAIVLGAQAQLLAPGAVLWQPNTLGLRQGDVQAGGTIAISAQRGSVLDLAGSRIDVSGTAATLDLPVSGPSPARTVFRPAPVASGGGSVSLSAAEDIVLDGAIAGKAGGGPGAAGGQLSVTLNDGLRNPTGVGPAFPEGPRSILIQQAQTQSLPAGWSPQQDIPATLHGQALLSADQLNASGFWSLALHAATNSTPNQQDHGEIVFKGDVNLNLQDRLTLDAPAIRWQAAGGGTAGAVHLSSAYAALGSTPLLQAPPAAAGGSGVLELDSGWLDLWGSLRLQGFGQAHLSSRADIRLISPGPSTPGELLAAGDIKLGAAQIYPSTLSDYLIAIDSQLAPQGTLSIASTKPGSPPVKAPLSAGGTLTLQAPAIVQQGVLRAPLGNIDLKSDRSLVLAAGSLTSTSARGLLIPFGRTQAGLDWMYQSGSTNLAITSPPAQHIELQSQAVDLKPGATVDISGGGDLYAFEFVAGPGGSVDRLNSQDPGFSSGAFKYRQSFAILPSLGSPYAPYDPIEFQQSGLQMGDSIYLSGGGGLARGEYTLLPAHYALLPGAYLVTPEPGSQDAIPGQAGQLVDGTLVVAGYLASAGTAAHATRWSGFAVEPGAVARLYSQYLDSFASSFFPRQAQSTGASVPSLPADAGSIGIAAGTSLSLGGSVLGAAQKGARGGQLDIEADRLAVLAQAGNGNAGEVDLVAGDLDRLGVASLLLGGDRSSLADGSTRLNVKTQSLTVQSGAKLRAPELLLASQDTLTVASGAEIDGAGAGAPPAPILKVANAGAGQSAVSSSDGALLRVSSGAQAQVVRDYPVSRQAGVIDVQAGAVLSADGAMLLDATRTTTLAGRIQMHGGSLGLASSRISLGAAPPGSQGLVLSNAQLNALSVGELALDSLSGIDVYGNVDLSTTRLSLQAAGISGYASAGQSATFTASDSLTLANPQGASAPAGSGSGVLSINARAITLGQGNFSISGFKSSPLHPAVSLNAAQTISGNGKGELKVAGDLDLTAAAIGSSAGATTTIGAGGYTLSIDKSAGAAPPSSATAGLGARLDLFANAIVQQGLIDLPAGTVDMSADAGGIALLPGAAIEVAGQAVALGNNVKFAGGGTVGLTAGRSNIQLSPGAAIDVSANRQGGDAGQLNISAPAGIATLDGALKATAPAGRGGQISLDVTDFGAGGFDGLIGKLAQAGFTDSVSLRQRAGDVSIGAGTAVKAPSFQLTSDTGSIAVAGTLDASAPAGGTVALFAGGQVVLSAGARIDAAATAANNAGGTVTLASAGTDAHGNSGVHVLAGAAIDVSGSGTGSGGSVLLRAPRAGNAVPVDVAAGAVNGAARKTVESVGVYTFAGDHSIGSGDIASWQTQTAAFMTAQPSAPAGFALVPGIEIDAGGNLSLDNPWDLLGWRYQGGATPGVLTLRAGGDLNIDQSLSDGFKYGIFPGTTTHLTMLQPGYSWSYRLVAGADLHSADAMAVRPPGAPADLTVAGKAQVRTGTGSIDAAAAGNIRLADSTSVIFTAGRQLPVSASCIPCGPYGDFGIQNHRVVSRNFYGEYPVDGGNLSLTAGGDIIGAPSPQLMSDWLVRTGLWNSANPTASYNRPTAWAIAFDNLAQPSLTFGFRENIGALGGGNVAIKAGGDVRDLSVMIPTTGKPVGSVVNNKIVENRVQVNGGGNLSLQASGDIAGGVFYVEKGQADIRSGGAITGGTQYTAGPVFALGDAQMAIGARDGIAVGGVINPFLLAEPRFIDKTVYFSTYSAASAVRFESTAGDIAFNNGASVISEQYRTFNDAAPNGESVLTTSDFQSILDLYPASLDAYALGGGMLLGNSINLFPSARGSLQLLAMQDIQTGAGVVINQLDLDPARIPSPQSPSFTRLSDYLLTVVAPNGNTISTASLHAPTPLHTGDPNPVQIVSGQGSIVANNTFIVSTAKAARISAGEDIRNVNLMIQNISASDISLLSAGRDITYTTQRDTSGNILSNQQYVQVSGPGQFQVLAGRNIDLGSSEGITAVGNTVNTALPDSSASISVLAGLSSQPDFEAFLKQYESQGPQWIALQSLLIEALQGKANEPEFQALSDALLKALPAGNGAAQGLGLRSLFQSLAQALPHLKANAPSNVAATLTKTLQDESALTQSLLAAQAASPGQALPRPELLQPVLGLLFDQIKFAGAIAAAEPTGSAARRPLYDLGTEAIRTLFPGSGYQGDIDLFFSTIQTFQGGSIDLLTPGGMVNAGLASAFAIAKQPKDLGVIVQQTGDINAMVNTDFEVNQSRVFTLDGGGITVWSANGNIDAGRGAKAAISSQIPIPQIDAKGNLVITFPPTVSGSGIRAQAGLPGQPFGDVVLAAPNGVVNANEAGIGGNNVLIAATAVIGASNIQAIGNTVGVPPAPVSIIPPSSVGNAVSSLGKSAAGELDSLAARSENLQKHPQFSMLTANVVGFGNCSVGDVRQGKVGCGN